MPPAANIDDVIAFAPTDIAAIAYGGAPPALLTQMNLWIAGVFAAGGIFPPSANETQPGQRPVTNWYAQHLKARDTIEGPGINDPGPLGTGATIDAVVRVAYAVKFAAIATGITAGQQTAVVTLYNTVWQ